MPVSQVQAHPDGHGHEDEAGEERQPPGDPHGAEDLRGIELPEPQDLGVDLGEGDEGDQQYPHGYEREQQRRTSGPIRRHACGGGGGRGAHYCPYSLLSAPSTEHFGRSEVSPSAYCSTDRKSTRLNSSHVSNSYAVFCSKK